MLNIRTENITEILAHRLNCIGTSNDAIAAVIWAFQAAIPGFIGGALIQDRPWLAMVFGFVLSGLLAGGIALGQHWWERRKRDAADGGEEDGLDIESVESGDVEAQAEREAFSRRVVSRVSGIPEETIEVHEQPASRQEPASSDSDPAGGPGPKAD